MAGAVMEGAMLTVALVLLLAMLLFAIGAVGALMVAGVRQIVDEIEIRESQRPDETTPEPSSAAWQASQYPF